MTTDLSSPLAILCDEIRREDNGKLLLLGVYTGDLIVPTFPHPMLLTYVVFLNGGHVGDIDWTFEVMLGDTTFATLHAGGQMNPRPRDFVIQIPVGPTPVTLTDKCDLVLRCTWDDGSTWHCASRIRVFDRESAPPVPV